MRNRKRGAYFSFLMSLVILSCSVFGINISSSIVQAADTYSPKSQTINETIQAEPVPGNPGTYWYQLDGGKFKADYTGGSVTVSNAGSCDKPFPADEKVVPDDVDLSNYPAKDWGKYQGWPISPNGVTGKHLKQVVWFPAPSYEAVGDPTITSSSTAILQTKTGGTKHPSEGPTEFMKRPNGCPKVTVMYLTPVDIIWEGTIHQTKEIDVNPDSTIKVGQKVQMDASVKTKNWGQDSWSNGVSVASRAAETRWYSSDSAIVEISSTGEITGKAPGKARVRAIWDNGTYRISDTAEITVTTQPGLVVNLPDACTSDTAIPKQAEAALTKPDKKTYILKSHPKLTWSSSNESIAKITPDGKITITGVEGNTNITAHFYDPTQNLDETDTKTFKVKDCSTGGGGNDGNDGGGGSCSPVISSPSKGIVNYKMEMEPSSSGVVHADERGSEHFNVLKGIPTSESLYVNVFGKNYLFQNKFANMTGKVTYTVQVKKTYILKWTIPGSPGDPPTPPVSKSDTVTVTKDITVERPYSYWQIDNLEAYKISKATVTNYALPSGNITLNPAGYAAPNLTSSNSVHVNDHVQPSPCQSIDLGTETKDGGSSRPSVPDETSEFRSRAESSVGQNKVRNDYVVFNGSTIMNNGWVDQSAPAPGSIPSSPVIERDVLYGKNYMISKTLVNKANTPSSGTIYYSLIPGNINGGGDKQFPINGINTVTVHTPVVNYSSITDDREHNQKTIPNEYRAALILDRPFSIRIPTSGQHVNDPGYGNRDYAKYFRTKQVWFPFDVYTADRGTFIPKRTWTDIPVTQLDTTFFLPVWVDEGDYTVLFRNVAENTPDSFTHQPTANTDWQHHVATHKIAVEVIGRVYDFHVTDIMDFNWETVFRKQKGSSEPTGNSYWVGANGIDGEARGHVFPYELPVRKGSHPDPSFKNVAVKTGYAFKFDLKTKGNMFGPGDGIHLKPTFYFTDSKGQKRQEVDVYYHTEAKKFIRIGSADDKLKRSMALNARLRNIPGQLIADAAARFYELFASSMMVNRQAYIDAWVRAAKDPTVIGSYSDLFLPYNVRTLHGPTNVPSGVSAARAYASIQQWYGEYNLPAKLYIVPKGFDLSKQFSFNDKAPFFLRDGFLIVNFDIETVRDGQKGRPHLQYIKAPLTNQWKREGSRSQFTDPYGVTFQLRDGDVMFYRADQSSVDDFGVTGTH